MTLEELNLKIKNLPKVDDWESSRESLKDRSEFFRSMIQKRIEHCEKQLEEHLHEANSICEGQIVVWNGGHFSVPVWDHLKRALEQDIKDWNALVWEQIIRQMGREEEHFESILWDIASECCLCQSQGIVSELDLTSINRHLVLCVKLDFTSYLGCTNKKKIMDKARLCEINKEILKSINFYEPLSLETSLEDVINDWGAE